MNDKPGLLGAVIGSPVSHSLSPALYSAAFEELGLHGRYEAVECAPENLGEVFGRLRRSGARAVSVTMPLKESVIGCLDEVDDDAELLRAVNCVSFVDGVARGHNTDGDGCCDALVEQGEARLDGASVVVLGAGGTARSVVLALGRRGAHVAVVNRTRGNADALVQRLSAVVVSSGGSLRVADPGDIASATVLVNTTSVGMNSTDCPVDPSVLHGELVVLDAVYSPMETTLLTESARRGARTVDGLWMLVQQARRQCWHQFGATPSAVTMRAAAERELAGRRK